MDGAVRVMRCKTSLTEEDFTGGHPEVAIPMSSKLRLPKHLYLTSRMFRLPRKRVLQIILEL